MIHKINHLDNTVLTPDDRTEVRNLSNKPKSIIGLPKIYDLKTGELLAEEENLVVLVGRELMATMITGFENPYLIRYFGIGVGGTDDSSGEPTTVGPFDTDTELASKVKMSTTGIDTDSNSFLYINNGYLKRIQSDGSISISVEEHTVNTENGTETVNKKTCITFSLNVQENEPADKPVKFNEAGLYAVKYENGEPVVDDDNPPILFARFTTLDKYLDIHDGVNIQWSILV